MGLVSSHADHVRETVASDAAGQSLLAASWRRCYEIHHLDPDRMPEIRAFSPTELTDLAAPAESLLVSGLPALERLENSVRGSGICLLFAGADGVSLRWWGAAGDEQALRGKGLCPGIDWSEATGGTNGIGTALAETHPMIVRQEQHFYRRDFDLACICAPVFDHAGRLAGAVNVSCYGAASRAAPVGLLLASVVETARQIEIDDFHRQFARARFLTLPGRGRSGAALLAVDRDDIVLGASRAARQSLGLGDAALKRGIAATDLMVIEGPEDGFTAAERGVLRRALLRNRGNVSATADHLGISRATIKRKILHHRLGRPR